MNLSRLNGWTVRYIMWGVSYKTLTDMLNTVKATPATENGPGPSERISHNPNPSEALGKLRALGIQVKDLT